MRKLFNEQKNSEKGLLIDNVLHHRSSNLSPSQKNIFHWGLSFGFMLGAAACILILRMKIIPQWIGLGVIPESNSLFIPMRSETPPMVPSEGMRFIYNLTHPICILTLISIWFLFLFKGFQRVNKSKKISEDSVCCSFLFFVSYLDIVTNF